MVPSDIENGPNRADRLEIIADLLADVPSAQRAEVIGELPPADRVAIPPLLIAKVQPEGNR